MERALFGTSVDRVHAARSESAHSATSVTDQIRGVVQKLSDRINVQEKRMREERLQAVGAKKKGRESEALQHMRRAKQIEGDIDKLRGKMSAMERQCDLLEENQLQKSVVDAMGAGARAMKANGSYVKQAEDAADSAIEIADMNEDVHSAFASLNEISNGDDDDLLRELEALVDATPETHDSSTAPSSSTTTVATTVGMATLTPAASEWPSVPERRAKMRPIEKQGLLASS